VVASSHGSTRTIAPRAASGHPAFAWRSASVAS
jgi:hypothetical protein